MAEPREYSGKGFILGGVTDDTPDWLGSYNEGFEGAQQQTTTRLNQQEARQRMGVNAAEEARRQAKFGWEAEDRALDFEAAGMNALPSQVPFNATPGPGLMPTLNIPAPIAPPAGLMEEPLPDNIGAITKEQKLAMLPEWARLEQAEGLPPNFLEAISMLESSGGVNTGNGGYVGIFQVGPEVAKDFGVTPEQLRDPRVNALIAAKLAGRNARQLREALGREPQPWEIYLAHQQGLGGALALLSNPNALAIDALTQAYKGDRTKAQAAIAQNGGDLSMTAAQFAQKWAEKFGGALPQPFTGSPGVQTDTTFPHDPTGRALLGGRAAPGVREQFAPAEKTDLPAGLLEDALPPAAPAAPPAGQITVNANGVPVTGGPAAPAPVPGLQPTSIYQPPDAALGDVVPRVSQEDFAGVQQPGQGSIASQIMRTPAGQQPVLPETGMYIVEPMMVTNELRQLAAQHDLIKRQFEVARKRRDFATMEALQDKSSQLGAATNLMQAMEVIAKMQQGDDQTFARAASGLTQGKMRLQPVSPNGTFNVYYNGELQGENVDRNQIIASLRMYYDRQYQALVAQRAKLADERGTKILESGLKSNEEINKQTADMYKLAAIERLKQSYPKDANVQFDAATGRLVVIPNGGMGQPEMWEITQEVGVDGQPVEVGGSPKMVLKRVQTSTGYVPVQ